MSRRLRLICAVLVTSLGLALPAIADGLTPSRSSSSTPRPATPVRIALATPPTATLPVPAKVTQPTATVAKPHKATKAKPKKSTKAQHHQAKKATKAKHHRAKKAKKAKKAKHHRKLSPAARKRLNARIHHQRRLRRLHLARIRAAKVKEHARRVAVAKRAHVETLEANPPATRPTRPNPFTAGPQLWRRPSVVGALMTGVRVPAITFVPTSSQRANRSTTTGTALARTPKRHSTSPRAPAARSKPRTKAPAKATPKLRAKATSFGMRRHPGWVGIGHYIRSLNGHATHDARIMRALGARDAARNPGGLQHTILLDIGGQVPHGVWLSTTHRFISYAALRRAVRAYVDGYHSRQRGNSPVTIAIGTNNDLVVNTRAGRVWANLVVDPIARAASGYPQVTIAGANDIEPGFRAGPGATQAWLVGFLRATSAPFVFNGSADACSWSSSRSRCGKGWTARQLAWFAGTAAPNRITALPQIYNRAMAGQWAYIARTAVLDGHRPLRILGPLTENLACGADPTCPTMGSAYAWSQLWSRLHRARVPVSSLPVQVDLDVR